MTRHSKNNTSSSFFTSAERSKLDYGTQKERLGKDSFRRPDACYICMQLAQDPVVCCEGHLFCRECILTAILAQRTQQADQRKAHNVEQARRREEEREKEAEKVRKRVAEFEAGQLGKRPKDGAVEMGPIVKENQFWLPSKAPSVSRAVEAPPKKEITKCPAADHPIAVKRLIPLVWTREDGRAICKCCGKGLADINFCLILYRPCGHCCCEKCHSQFAKDSHQCLVCEAPTTESLSLVFDGTGYSNKGGTIELKKSTPAFF